MINKIIANYLAGGKRLVVPQFGAFIHKEGDGVVVFVPFLKKDDGVLVGLLRQEYGLDEADARGVITEYIAQIGSGIAERGSFAIEGVGRLKIDANGIFFLEYAPVSDALLSGTSGMHAAGAPSAAAAVTPSAPPVAAVQSQPAAAPRDAVREAYYGSSSAPQGTVPVRPVTAQTGIPAPQPAARPVQSATSTSQTQPQTSPQAQPQRPAPAPAPGQNPAQPRQPMAQPGQQAPYPGQPGQSAVPPRPSAPGYGPQGQPAVGGQPPVGGRPTGRPMPPRPRPGQAPAAKSDKFMVIAILAAVVALASIVYGVMSSSDGPMIDPMELPAPHQSAQDSLSAEAPAPETAPAR